MDREQEQSKSLSSTHFDLEDSKRRVHIGDHLLKLNELFDPVALHELRTWAVDGRYGDLYRRLLEEWNTLHTDNTDLINALMMCGMGAGLTPGEIAEDMS